MKKWILKYAKREKTKLEKLDFEKQFTLNIENPKPDRNTKQILMLETGLKKNQIRNWIDFQTKKKN